MLHIGCHLSASKGYLAMGKDALKIGAERFCSWQPKIVLRIFWRMRHTP